MSFTAETEFHHLGLHSELAFKNSQDAGRCFLQWDTCPELCGGPLSFYLRTAKSLTNYPLAFFATREQETDNSKINENLFIEKRMLLAFDARRRL